MVSDSEAASPAGTVAPESRPTAAGARPWGTLIAMLSTLAAWAALRRFVITGVDLALYDETLSLAAGARWLRHGALSWDPTASPLYGLWHALWLRVAGDAIASYYVQWLATDLLVVVAVFLVARRLRLGPVAASAAAVLWALSDVASTGWPRVYMFALLVVLLGLLAVLKLGRSWPGGLALALAALVRPEYQLALVIWCAVMLARRLPAGYRGWAGLAAGLSLLALVIFGDWGGGRLWLAFRQHVALRYADSHPGLLSDPWIQADPLAERLFPGAHSLAQAVRVSPGLALRHVARNLAELPSVVVTGASQWPHLGSLHWPGVCLLVVGGLAGAVRLWRAPRGRLRAAATSPAGVFTLCAASAVLPSLLVMAKATYAVLVVLAVVVSCVAGLAWAGRKRLGARRAPGALVLVGIALIPWLVPRPPAAPRGVLMTALGLRRVWAAAPGGTRWRMLEADGGWCVYLDVDGCERVAHASKPTDLGWSRFVADQRINAVVVTPRLLQTPAYRDDADFQRWHSQPERLSFRLAYRNGWASLYLRDGQGPRAEAPIAQP